MATIRKAVRSLRGVFGVRRGKAAGAGSQRFQYRVVWRPESGEVWRIHV